MSRYIDADALINTLGISDEEIDFKEILREAPTIEVVSVEDYRSMENTCYKLQKALYEMADAPSIDIVRCKECRHNVGLSNGDGFWEEDIVCDYWDSDGLTADDYCSYGERKEKCNE